MNRAPVGGRARPLPEVARPYLALPLLAIAACSAAEDPSPAAGLGAPRAIAGGTEDLGDPAVVALVARRTRCEDDETEVFCTGTLIAPRVVLTAAHCLMLGPDGAYEVSVGSRTGSGAEGWAVVVETRTHPAFDPVTHASDLALLRLAEEAPVAAGDIPALADAWSPAVGEVVRVVGFGATAPRGLVGTKRTGSMVVSEVSAGAIVTTPSPAMSCPGDSGGPVLATLADGREVVAAVTASGDLACAEWALNVRVDAALADFIAPFLAEVETIAPGFSGSIDPAALCSASCAASAECPAGLVCVVAEGPGRCVLPGPGEGDFGAACEASAECGGEECVRLTPGECRCLSLCAGWPGERSEAAGCAAGGAPALLVAPLAAAWLLTRGRKRRETGR